MTSCERRESVNDVSGIRCKLCVRKDTKSSSKLTGPERARQLTEGLKKSNVGEVAFFANSKKLNKEGIKRLKTYSDSGHLIGNHTHLHPELNKTDLEVYIEDIRLADKLLKSLHGFINWFRFPFLREGDTKEKRERVKKELDCLGYRNAYITVNNFEKGYHSLYKFLDRFLSHIKTS